MVVLFFSDNLSHVEKAGSAAKARSIRAMALLDENASAWFAAKIITGEQFQVDRGMRGNGTLRIICPGPEFAIQYQWMGSCH